jgi:hypothetical protein
MSAVYLREDKSSSDQEIRISECVFLDHSVDIFAKEVDISHWLEA